MSRGSWLLAVLLLACGVVELRAGDAEVVRLWSFDSADGSKGWTIGNGLKDLAAADGRLRMTITAPDAFLFAPPVEVPLDGCVIRIRLRSDRDGHTQVYWKTDDRPGFGEHHQRSLFSAGSSSGTGKPTDDGFVTLEYPIGTPADAGRKLTGFRIDPYNGNKEGSVEIDLVELVRTPPVIDVRFAAKSHLVQTGQREPAWIGLRQIAGRASSEAVSITVGDGPAERVTLSLGQATALERDLLCDRPGVHKFRARVAATGGAPMFDLATSVIGGRGELLPLIPCIRSDRVRLDFVPTPDGKRVGAARWMIADPSAGTNEWRLAGWLLPLVQLTIEGEDGEVIRREPAMTFLRRSDRTAELRATLEDVPGWKIEVRLHLVEKGGQEAIAVTARLAGPDGGKLLDFSGPILRADRESAGDPLDRFAVFGGLEFLEPGWRSSSDRAVGDRFADRWTPHPFKVTLPVMAVEADGMTSALMWDPLETWAGDETMPTATFASPNFLDDQPNHLMKLSVPTIPRWREENEQWARQPYVMRTDRGLTLRCLLYGEADLPAAMASRRWYEMFGPPTPPPATHDDGTLHDLIARHYGETMYWPNEKGWRTHWYLGDKSSYTAFMAAELIAHAMETGNKLWIERTGLTKRTMIDAAGTLASRLQNDRNVWAQIRAMRPDGTWPFVNTKQMRDRTRKFTEGKHDSLGEDGSTSLGTCVQAAMPVLRYAELTGDEKCVAASLKALEAMKRFRVPRGAQVWEVHQQIPDIRAAALAVEAFRIGYHLTGNEGYLDEADYWAWAGVPFLYGWHVPIERREGSMVASRDRDDWDRFSMPLSEGFQDPERQVTPYASVPVLGPTFYVINWFGVIVQWCGLEWAWKVIELDQDRPEPLLRYIADGVVASGLQQTFDRPPWVGLYPDVWNTEKNIAHGAFICAMLPANCLRAQGRIPRWPTPWTRVLHDQPVNRRWHVSGWGRADSLDSPVAGGSWSATITFPTGQPNELIVAGVDEPRRADVAGQPLDHIEKSASPTSAGWRYDSERRVVAIRFLQSAEYTELTIHW